MYYLGVLCLLSAAVALPRPEQLHTNLPAPPPPPQLKSEEERLDVVVDPPAPIPDEAIEEPDKSDEFKNPSESDDKFVQIDEEVHKEVNLVQEESKESKESKDSKEKSKEYKESKESKEFKESKELKDPKENEKPEEPKDYKKEKDSKSEESVKKEREEEEYPVVVQVIQGSSFLDWLDKLYDLFHDIKLPSIPWPFRRGRSELQNVELEQQDEPIYIFKESDIGFE